MKHDISLILGSGGARGLAHIGVIHELERQGFRIKSVSGCSIGALIGGCYCAGKLDIYEEWATRLTRFDVVRFLDISLTPRAGMMKGDLIIETLREMIGNYRIEDLPLPFTAVATDIVAKKEVWLNTGDLFDVIRASIAIPGIVTPKTIGGHKLVDGGLLNPLPGAPAMLNAAELSVAVSLTGPVIAAPYGPVKTELEPDPLQDYRNKIDGFLNQLQESLGLETENNDSPKQKELSLTDVLLSMFDTMQAAIARHRLASYPPDLLIEIPSNICQTHEFFKARELIEAGRYWADHALQKHVERNQE